MGDRTHRAYKINIWACFFVCILFISSVAIVSGSIQLQFNTDDTGNAEFYNPGELFPTSLNIDDDSTKSSNQDVSPRSISNALRAIDVNNWTMLHGDNNNLGYSEATVPKLDNVLWSKIFKDANNDPTTVYSSPVVVGDQLFVATGDHKVYSMDKYTTEINWMVSTDDMPGQLAGDSIESTPTVVNDRLYIGCDDKYIYCFDATPDDNGNGVIDISDTDDGIANTPGADHDIIWYFKTNGSIKSSPKVSGNTVIIGCFNNDPDKASLYALSATDGTLIWNFTAESKTNFYSTPAIDDGVVYAGLETLTGAGIPTVYAFDLDGFADGNDGWKGETKTGNKNADILWNFTSEGGVDSSITVAGDKVLFGTIDNNGTVFTLDKQDGSEIWNKTTGAQVFSSPAVDQNNNVMYIGSDNGKLFALNLSNGNTFWTYPVGDAIKSTPVIAKDIVMFGSNDNHLYALEATTAYTSQRFIWKYDTYGLVVSSAAPIEGVVYFSSESGYVYAFANPDLAVEFGSLTVSDHFPYEGESIELSARVFNDGSIKMGAEANFYYFVSYPKPSKRLIEERLISSHYVTLDVDEDIIINTQSTVFEFDWSSPSVKTTIVIKIENVSFPEKDELEPNNLDIEEITVLEHFDMGWMSYQSDNSNTGHGDIGAKTNKTVWEFDTNVGGSSKLQGSPVFAKGRVFIGSTNGKFYSVLDTTGKKDWEFNAGSPIIGSPALLMNDASQTDYEKVFFGTDSGKLYALTINRGKFNWSFDTGGEIIRGSPVIANGLVFIGTSAGNLYALDEDGFFDNDQGLDDANESLQNGDIIWSLSLTDTIKSAPAVIDDLVILTTISSSGIGKIIAIELLTGVINWSYTFDDSIDGSPIIDAKNNQVLIGCNDDRMYALDVNGLTDGNDGWTGEKTTGNINADILWRYNAGANILATGALDSKNNRLVFGTSTGIVYALNSKTGNKVWHFNASGIIRAPPTIADGLVYVASDNGIVYCVNEFRINTTFSNTSMVWYFDTNSTIRAPPLCSNYGTFIAAENGILYKLGAPNEPPVAVLTKPGFNQKFFDDEDVILDATGSYDPEGDKNLTYVWTYVTPGVVDVPVRIYSGKNSVYNTTLPAGDHTIFLIVIDGLGMPSIENSTNISVFSPVIRLYENETIPALCKIYFDGAGGVDLYKGIDPGAGTVDSPSGKSVGGINKFFNLYYSPHRTNYKVGWYNVSTSYSDDDLPYGYNESRIRMFKRMGTFWVKCENTGVIINDNIAWANLTGSQIISNRNQLFAPGTFDNLPPTIRIMDDGPIPKNGSKKQTFEFNIEYTDADDDLPKPENGGYVKIMINGIEYTMNQTNPGDNDTADGKFYKFTIQGIELISGINKFSIQVHDGTYLVTTDEFDGPEIISGEPPVANAGNDQEVKKGEVFKLDASASNDPDGTIMEYLWDTDGDSDFTDSDGSTKGITPTWKFDNTGVYTITLFIEDNDGNTDTDTVNITVVDKKDEEEEPDYTMIYIYAGILGLIVLIVLIAILLLIRRRIQTERDRKAFMVEEEGEEEEEEGEEEEEEELEEEEKEGEKEEGEEEELEEEELEELEEEELEELEEEEMEEELEEEELEEEELEEKDIEKELEEELEVEEEPEEAPEEELEHEAEEELEEPEEEEIKKEEPPEEKVKTKKVKRPAAEKKKLKVKKVKGPMKADKIKSPKKLKKKLK